MQIDYSLSRNVPINAGVVLFHYLIKNFPFQEGMKFIWVDYPNNESGKCAVFQSRTCPNFINGPFFRVWDGDFVHVGWITPQDNLVLPQFHEQRAFDRNGAYPCQDYLSSTRSRGYRLELERDLLEYGLSQKRIDALIERVVSSYKKFEGE